ncbi:protein FAR1-RELATED SEQUENCE 8-like isoform X1 [Benincasa hispida]|uniref:protein FAR1-RELATED SEQUENCE 8-like isoform X1 n=1 Tax=Benincasa hispida TaxID=102211 RepID=UPI0019003F14|nr:protein FAR1-RELATED SEQUENCE 8-like isoform X1 [Benincasa hispida]
MTGDDSFSLNDDAFAANPNFDISIEEGSQNSGELLEEEGNNLESECEHLFRIDEDDLDDDREEKVLLDDSRNHGNDVNISDGNESFGDDISINADHEHDRDESSLIDCQIDLSGDKDYPPPVAGMEFESYDDAYNYYNCYAKELGFAIRVKSSWTKRNSKEKRGAVLCCNCEGFKTLKEVNSRRKETRTGCLAMIRLRLVEFNRWRVDEVKLEHNHSFDPERAQNSKSHKRMDIGTKRKVEPSIDVEVQTIKLYRSSALDAMGHQGLNSNGESKIHVYKPRRLLLKKGDAQVIHNFFHRVQLTDPNFFYVMDLYEEGLLRNVFWINSRCRAAYSYFNDVVAFDTTCLSSNFEIPLFAFVGINHHGQSILLGCGLLADETPETYVWLLRAWLTCMSGRPPQTIITNRCKALQGAIAEVFPRAHHRLCLSDVMQNILENVGELQESETFHAVLSRTIYDYVKVEEFEMAWEDMIQHFGIKNNECIQSLYDERERWAPVFSKETFFAGMYNCQKGDWIIPFFHGYVHQQTSLNEFFNIYVLVLQKKQEMETRKDLESSDLSLLLKSRCLFELQLAKLYTMEIFSKFQDEIVMMSSCFSLPQVETSGGPIMTFVVKEREGEEISQDGRSYEVMYDKAGGEIRCICNCFNFKGYLCRHALFILSYNGIDEIPYQYILSRWRKDFKRLYVPDLGRHNIDITNPVQWFDHLYRRATQVVQEGMTSQDHYMVAWQALKESLNKVRLVSDRHV